ncbi:MAG: hypothetical protein HQL87_15540 [Magnetococcales bacterium]|nr:hypothetical protein [Magnetococcales bacterium]
MEELQVSQPRRHGNGLLDRIAVCATPKGLRTPPLHVRNRWSRLNPGFSVAFGHSFTDQRSERAGA